MKSHSSRLFDAAVKIETLFWMPGLQAAVPDEFRDFINNDLDDAKELHKQLPWLKTFLRPDFGMAPDEWPGEFHRKGHHGYLANLARPIPHDFSKDGRSHQYSWGHYQCRWVYFDSLDALVDYAEAFSKEIVERERAKSNKPKRQKARA